MKAEQYFDLAITIGNNAYGNNHICLATNIGNLGNVYLCQGKI